MIRIVTKSPNFKVPSRGKNRFNSANANYTLHRLQRKNAAGAWEDVSPLCFSVDELNHELTKLGCEKYVFTPSADYILVEPLNTSKTSYRPMPPSPTADEVLDWIFGRTPAPKRAQEVAL